MTSIRGGRALRGGLSKLVAQRNNLFPGRCYCVSGRALHESSNNIDAYSMKMISSLSVRLLQELRQGAAHGTEC